MILTHEVLPPLPSTQSRMEALARPRTSRQFANEIRSHLSRSVEEILAVGELLIEAKQTLQHGKFEAMVEEELGWSPATAQRLMIVARTPFLSNPAHGQLLPTSWRTLYELSQVPEDEFRQAIEAGAIKPEITRSEVLALRGVQAKDRYSIYPCPRCSRPTMTLWHTFPDKDAVVVERMYRCRPCEEADPASMGYKTREVGDGPVHKRSLS
jgi:hypothetical protein